MIVVDSQGNEYEATYPKRAKGLVKSGRARFVGENKICLACPPKDNLEDKNMENNTNTVETTANTELTAKEIFDQIVALQNELKNTQSLQNMVDAIRTACSNGDVNNEVVESITLPFAQREDTLRKMLAMYEKMYYDMQQEKSRTRQEKIETVQSIWYKYLVEMDGWFDEDAMAEAKNYVRSQIDLLVMDIMADKI